MSLWSMSYKLLAWQSFITPGRFFLKSSLLEAKISLRLPLAVSGAHETKISLLMHMLSRLVNSKSYTQNRMSSLGRCPRNSSQLASRSPTLSTTISSFSLTSKIMYRLVFFILRLSHQWMQAQLTLIFIIVSLIQIEHPVQSNASLNYHWLCFSLCKYFMLWNSLETRSNSVTSFNSEESEERKMGDQQKLGFFYLPAKQERPIQYQPQDQKINVSHVVQQEMKEKAFQYGVFKLLRFKGKMLYKFPKRSEIHQIWKIIWSNSSHNKTQKPYWLPIIDSKAEIDFIGNFTDSIKKQLRISKQSMLHGEFGQKKIVLLEIKISLKESVYKLVQQCLTQIAHIFCQQQSSEKFLGVKKTTLAYVWVCNGDRHTYQQRLQQLKEMKCLQIVTKIFPIQLHACYVNFQQPQVFAGKLQQFKKAVHDQQKQRYQALLIEQLDQQRQQDEDRIKQLQKQRYQDKIRLQDDQAVITQLSKQRQDDKAKTVELARHYDKKIQNLHEVYDKLEKKKNQIAEQVQYYRKLSQVNKDIGQKLYQQNKILLKILQIEGINFKQQRQ